MLQLEQKFERCLNVDN